MCLFKWLFVQLMKPYVREAKGFENIPESGPAILVANHSSYIDAPLICALTDWHCKRWPRGIIYKGIYEKNRFIRYFAGTVYRAIPTNGSVGKAIEALARGDIIMLFPEGGRSLDGKMQKCTHQGLGAMASATGAPAIPVGIRGTYGWWPAHRRMPSLLSFKKISIKVGKPVKYSGKATKKDRLSFQRKVMRAVAKLARTKYPY
ncbi:MAG: lysophospholipid acyltransferase family protein [Candidatus Woesearchaeota archaeon]